MATDAGRANAAATERSTTDAVRTDLHKTIKVNPAFRIPQINVREFDRTEKKFRCCMCGTTYTKQTGNFPSGGASILWRGNNGYVPICKNCSEFLMEMYTSFYGGNEEHALRHMCQLFDWYYCDTASAMTLSQVHYGKSRVSLYPSKMTTRQVVTKGETFLDTVRDEFNRAETIRSTADIDSHDENSEEEFVVTKDLVQFWGSGYKPSDYEFLKTQYDDWITRNECKTKAQEELFKLLSIAQLNILIAQRDGGKVSDAMKAFQDLLGSSNLKPAQTNDNAMADANTFSTLIKKWEDERPIPEPDPEWEDVDGIKKLITTFFLGHLSKALHIKNDASAQYEEEMKKYTVSKPQYKQEEDDAPTAIFDDFVEGRDAK